MNIKPLLIVALTLSLVSFTNYSDEIESDGSETTCVSIEKAVVGKEAHVSLNYGNAGAFAKDKKRINELKNQLMDKLRPSFRMDNYHEDVFLYTKGAGTGQINIYKSSTDYDSDLKLSFTYKISFSNIEKVEIAGLKDNTKEACAIKIHLKKPGTYLHIQHTPRFVKEKRNVYSILLQASSNRADMIEAKNILLELVDECQ